MRSFWRELRPPDPEISLRARERKYPAPGSSDGSAGRLDHLIVIWWDKDAKNYGFFVCFKDWGSGCEIRGTARWEADEFVNDYTEDVKGKPAKMRDTFTSITPNSHTLIAAIKTADGKMKTLITTRSTRR